MKVFLSHAHCDKPIVEKFAYALRTVLGANNVFYDSWSIQPGESIIDRMNTGLGECDVFFFFVSKSSLTSEMAKLEWQAALMRTAKEGIRFVPIKLDDCEMPTIMLQNLYINVFQNGIEAGIRQIMDVVCQSEQEFSPETIYRNIRAYFSAPGEKFKLELEMRAEAYMEPISKYAILLKNPKAKISCLSDSMMFSGEPQTFRNDNGEYNYLYFFGTTRATTPGFPFRVSILDDSTIDVQGVFHAVGENEYEKVPVVFILSGGLLGINNDVEIEMDKVIGAEITMEEKSDYIQNKIREAKSSEK